MQCSITSFALSITYKCAPCKDRAFWPSRFWLSVVADTDGEGVSPEEPGDRSPSSSNAHRKPIPLPCDHVGERSPLPRGMAGEGLASSIQKDAEPVFFPVLVFSCEQPAYGLREEQASYARDGQQKALVGVRATLTFCCAASYA
jgi:hypothetical protein